MAPAFGALVKVAPEKPTITTECDTPGVACTISVALRITSSVRRNEEPGGSCAATMRMPRSICGMKPCGVVRNSLRPKARIAA